MFLIFCFLIFIMYYLLGYLCDVEGCIEVMKIWILLIKYKYFYYIKGKVLVME